MTAGAALARWFGGNGQRDGQAEVLEQPAIGMDATGGSVQPDRPIARLPGDPRAMLDAALAEKVLYGWLQNRHQTLYPLTINFRTLSALQRGCVLRLMAIALLAGNTLPGGVLPERMLADAHGWLGSVGADATDQALLDATLAAPPPLSQAVSELQEASLGTYAYAVSLIAAARADVAGQLFLDYIAARFAVPPNVARSIQRRYRL